MLAVMCVAMMISGCSDQTVPVEEDQNSSDVITELSDLRDFTALSSDDEKITQGYFADYDVTIINIWATFCPPCLEEMPELAELDSSRPDNIGMMLICADGLAEPDYMQEILESVGFKGINLVSGDGDYEKLLESVQFVPTTVFVDSEGNLVGEPVIGKADDPRKTYFEQINAYLKKMGMETVD